MVTYKGWRAHILKGGTPIGYTESVTVDIASGLEPYYEHGSRRPVDLAEGNEEITGSISRAWINMDLLGLITDDDGKTGLDEFELYLYIDPYESEAPWMYLYYCKLESGSIDLPQDGFLMSDVDFRARYLVYGAET